MESEWQAFLLEDLADDITVGHVGTMASEYVENGVPFLRSLNIQPHRVVIDDIRFITPDFHQRLRKSALRPGDVVIVRTGKPGTCAVIPDWLPDANCSDVVIVRCGPRLNNRFLSYFVNSVAAGHVAAHTVGAVQQHFNVGSARKIRIPLPSLREQLEVASTLGVLDEKISLLRETNATLEAIAQALFKSWFVDFDPVRAKAEGRDPEGVSPEVANLFPSEFKESELGAIPNGWLLTPLGSLGSLTKGCSYKGSGLSDDYGAYMFNLGCFNAKRVYAKQNIKRYTGEYKPRHEVRAGDLIIANTDMTQARDILGRPLLVPQGFSPGFVSHHVFRVAMDPQFDTPEAKAFIFFALQQPTFRERAIGFATGTTVLAMPKEAVEEYQVPLPPPSLLKAFAGLIAPMLARVEYGEIQCESLAELRDALLPRLMSGKLRIPADEEVSA